MINAGGVERGSTILLSGGCGSGKTIFAMQSAYNAAQNGEKSLYLSFEESPEKIRGHMKKSFSWDLDALEKKNLIAVRKVNPMEFLTALGDSPEEAVKNNRIKMTSSELSIMGKKINLPFKPDRVILDSNSALSLMFENITGYRIFLKELIESLNENNSVNLLVSETEQEPTMYSKIGIEEFLADGVIVLYNLRKGQLRRRAIEILKLRSSDHLKEMVPYIIGKDGIKILQGENVY
ncbi:MAG: hypothetical protein FJY77_05415 [Candidatus Altiarchaeales archaeon]|nr:hypothetical protein [Candidatus Altiarchaeales archaeon]